MAVTKREYTIAANWNSNDVLDTLETALSDVGFHAAAQSGTILTFTNTSGTTISGQKGHRYLVKQSETSGSGVYATFDVLRDNNGAISTVTLVRGGKNYAGSDTITISGADIGGTAPTDNITVTVSTVSGSQGTTSTWYDEDTSSPYTWGVCCVNNDETKKMGQTYYSFYTPANPTSNPVLYIKSGPGFQSNTNVFTGVSGLDFINSTPNNTTSPLYSLTFARSNTTPIKLITYQSGIDSNFVVFRFGDVEKYGDVYRDLFFLSKYNTATQPWSLDDCFTGGVYNVGRSASSSTAEAHVNISLTGLALPKRSGEWGYSGGAGSGARTNIAYYESVFGRRGLGGTTAITTQYASIYQRSLYDLTQTSLEYNPVITGIPICYPFVPVPYYLPADFGVTEIIGSNTTAYRDVIKVGGTTEWTVLQFGNNLTYSSAIAFVAKTVD